MLDKYIYNFLHWIMGWSGKLNAWAWRKHVKILRNKKETLYKDDLQSFTLLRFLAPELDNFENKTDEGLLYSILNHSKQYEKYVVINSLRSLKEENFKLNDLKSRINSFVFIGIELPTDDLLKVIISKYFSEKQININPKISEYIIKNVDRSYEKTFKFIKEVDELSLSSGKSININLIKKVLNQ